MILHGHLALFWDGKMIQGPPPTPPLATVLCWSQRHLLLDKLSVATGESMCDIVGYDYGWCKIPIDDS